MNVMICVPHYGPKRTSSHGVYIMLLHTIVYIIAYTLPNVKHYPLLSPSWPLLVSLAATWPLPYGPSGAPVCKQEYYNKKILQPLGVGGAKVLPQGPPLVNT